MKKSDSLCGSGQLASTSTASEKNTVAAVARRVSLQVEDDTVVDNVQGMCNVSKISALEKF